MNKTKDIYETIGSNIAMYRKNLGMNLKTLAAKSAISISFLGNIEKGTRKPTLHTLQKIAASMNIGIISFFSNRISQENISDDAAITFSIMKIISEKSPEEKKKILGILKLL